ncbi:hypothetical protein [Robiginitalea biformata]|uniref:Uncharacterized protein n=1 Tax=Robiginitalea biformata (strain ATCC BAA-864 / DSM 15991 / KCTC 12146 / HTCC2501) TaxID=313596 RepID=A4CMI5_ROBBH|nr:hypothetical protein [Robiginitalea biformata]EAR14877.1 hypothetical protein RB2501_11142 [Robiginitalea biformata HTCC2501]
MMDKFYGIDEKGDADAPFRRHAGMKNRFLRAGLLPADQKPGKKLQV